MALAAIDMALWDALARSHGTSLVRLLGGVEKPFRRTARSATTARGSRAQVAEAWAKRGFTGVKAKIGYPTRATRTSRSSARCGSAVGADVAIMVDYNQCLTPAEAVQRMRVLDDEGLDVGRGADARARLRRPRAGRARGGDADPVRRELVGHARLPARDRRARVGLRDARRDEDRRRHRLAARRGHRAGARASACRTTCGPRSARSSCA